jgi:hypothetical protein
VNLRSTFPIASPYNAEAVFAKARSQDFQFPSKPSNQDELADVTKAAARPNAIPVRRPNGPKKAPHLMQIPVHNAEWLRRVPAHREIGREVVTLAEAKDRAPRVIVDVREDLGDHRGSRIESDVSGHGYSPVDSSEPRFTASW